jgi:hypothetical protein
VLADMSECLWENARDEDKGEALAECSCPGCVDFRSHP